MQEYIIDITQIEELQAISNRDELDKIFSRAKQTIVNGEAVLLVRGKDGSSEKFDELTTLEELTEFKTKVYKYL